MSTTPHIPGAHEIETRSGNYVNTRRPRPETILLADIAHALSQICRYGGHCDPFYSVAEHAVFVSKRVERRGESIDVQLAALHHDDAEAYLGDIPRPLKPLLGQAYRQLTAQMDDAIQVALKLERYPGGGGAIKEADNWALLVEARYLIPSEGRQWLKGDQKDMWELSDLPSRIVTPDYWLGGLDSKNAYNLYINRHTKLLERKRYGS